MEVRSASAPEAYRDASAAAQRVLQAIDEAGIPAARRSIRRIDLRAETTWSERQSVSVTGYVASNQLSVTVDRISTASSVLESVVTAGGDHARVDSVSLGFSNRGAYDARAQEQAWRDAHAKALRWAELSGCSLGKVTEISEGSVAIPLRAARIELMAEQGMPIEAGTLDITRTVTGRWNIASWISGTLSNSGTLSKFCAADGDSGNSPHGRCTKLQSASVLHPLGHAHPTSLPDW